MGESWLIRLFEHFIIWLVKRRDVNGLMRGFSLLNQLLDSISLDSYLLLSRWSRSEQWILRFYAGRELWRCYDHYPIETRQHLYQLAKDIQFRVREGAAWGGVALLRQNFKETWGWLSFWCEDPSPEVRQTAAMILLPFIQADQLPTYAQLSAEQLRLDSHKQVFMIVKRWDAREYTCVQALH